MIPTNIFLYKRLHHKGYSFHNIGDYSGVNLSYLIKILYHVIIVS